MGSEQENFVSHYQRTLFQDTSDAFKKAEVKRKTLAMKYKASFELSDNTTSCLLLEDDLSSYSKLVDERSGINNYAKAIGDLVEGSDTKCKEWTSSLTLDFAKSLIETLPCASDGINCKSNEITEADIRKLYKKPAVIKQEPKPQIPNVKNAPQEKKLAFRTASEELQAQNIKKYSNSGGDSAKNPLFSYGGRKRSLGTRKGVNSKFVSPVLTDDSSEDYMKAEKTDSQGSDEIVDKRLKNIEPKMVELIKSEIMDNGTIVDWEDIAGLEFAKNAIKEAVVWPLLRPDIFTGLRRPPKGILLFGPPGTGKTLIGKCIASQSQSTFFSISASSLTSKWIGDGEKMVRALFAVATCHQPAVIFIDEIDSLLTQRSDTEHESTRRIKTEFLVQLDGATTTDDERLLVVGATNRPQELDEAARRRFVKRLYIPLPELSARVEIVKRLMSSERHTLSKEDVEKIAELADGYSGADMRTLCSEASLGPIRSIDIQTIKNIEPDQVRPVTMDDFHTALRRVRASVSPKDLDQYLAWDKTYGSGAFH